MGVALPHRHRKAAVKVLFRRLVAVLFVQLTFQVEVAHRPSLLVVVIHRLFRQHIQPQGRHQRRRVIIRFGQRGFMKAGRIAQVYLPVGAFLRHPVVQRVGPALEFWRILQRGIGRQQGITAVGMVHPLHHPAVVKGVFQLYSAHIVFTAHPVLVAFGQQAVQRRGCFQRLGAP